MPRDHPRMIALVLTSLARSSIADIADVAVIADRIKGMVYGGLVGDALSLAGHYEYDAVKLRDAYKEYGATAEGSETLHSTRPIALARARARARNTTHRPPARARVSACVHVSEHARAHTYLRGCACVCTR